MKTYISLFSSAGVGCYGFKMEGFECIATNELLERRLNIQKINNKCKYDSGYIGGDITDLKNQELILNEIKRWEKTDGLKAVDVLMATPPCQGMSTANYKKGDEINRNSLVVEAIHLVEKISPRVFVFENVRAFLDTMCVDKDEEILPIKDCIYKNLSTKYYIHHKVINFMDYGVPSSRPRTIVIGTLKTEKNFSPLNIFPLKQKQVTLKDAIGNLKSLDFGERDEEDLYHSFRVYPVYMREWIHSLKEGESAFSNKAELKPYKIVNGERQILKSGHMGNKFRRMYWNKPAPCITTRNDQLASQTTIHPIDDRVLSIRELMRVMSIPDDFNWVENFNKENVDKNETLIRQSIGEAVPTHIIRLIAKNIKEVLEYSDFIQNYSAKEKYNETNYSDNIYIKSFLYEKKLNNTKETGSFYTPQTVVYNTIKDYKTDYDNIRILEPSVGVGAFIPQFLRLVDDCNEIVFDLIDISNDALRLLDEILKQLDLSKKFIFNYICDDFLLHDFENKYDVIISNPPYFKMDSMQKKQYSKYNFTKSDNIFCLFLDKFRLLTETILCVIPKNFIMIADCNDIRKKYEMEYIVHSIYDYGVNYFKEVFIEIVSIHFKKEFSMFEKTYIANLRDGFEREVDCKYIFHDKVWLLYRDEWFDNYIKKLKLDSFDFYRDRQLTNKYLFDEPSDIWVVRSKNLLDNGQLVHKVGYDKYVNKLDGFTLNNYFGKEQIIFTNFTYNTRATILPANCSINGSFCILIPKNEIKNKNINEIDLSIYATDEFRRYYAIIKNLSKFTINVDSNTVYYIGVMNER